jgi:hypothetical protein
VTELARNLIGLLGFNVHELNRQVLKLENRVQTPDIRFSLKVTYNNSVSLHKLGKIVTLSA